MKFLPPDSATVIAVDEKYGGWTRQDRLLAIIANMLRLLWWGKTKDGRKGRKRPAMIGPDMGDDAPPRKGLKVKPSKRSVIARLLGLDQRPATMSEAAEYQKQEQKISSLFGG